MREYPAGYAGMAIALGEHLRPPNLLVLRGQAPEVFRWRDELVREYLPDTQIFAVPDGAASVPAALAKPARGGPVNGWLCRGVICLTPKADLVQMKAVCKEKT
jgi:uncharacterized protein YyaL (SSP411 family)